MALNFDSAGSSRRVDHGSGATLDNLHSSAFTAWFWLFRTSDGDNQVIYTKDNTGSVGHLALVDNAPGEGGLSFVVQRATTDASVLTTAATGLTSLNTNYFVAFVYDPAAAQTCRVYRGTRTIGVVECSYSSAVNGSGAAVSDAAASLIIGNYGPSLTLPFRGTISRGGFVGRALNIQTLRYLHLQGSGDIANCNVADTKLLFDYLNTSSVSDQSGNGNNGTVTGATDATHVPLPTKMSVTDTDLFFSPYNTFSNGGGALQANNIKGSSTYALWNNPGAYLRFKVSVPAGPSAVVGATFDVSGLSGIAAADCPVIQVKTDNGAWGRVQLSYVATDEKNAVVIATLLATGEHTIELMFAGVGFGSTTDRWTTPANAVKLLGIHLDTSNLDLTTNVVARHNLLVYGASSMEGYAAIAAGTAVANHDAALSAARVLAKALDAEYGIVAFAGQGFVKGISNQTAAAGYPSFYNTTDANESWDKYFSGQSRLSGGLLTPVPTWIVIQHGWNDESSLTATVVRDAVEAVQDAAPEAFIYVVGHQNAVLLELAAGVALMSDRRKVVTVTPDVLLTLGTPGEFSFDGLHVNAAGHGVLAAEILAQTRTATYAARIIVEKSN